MPYLLSPPHWFCIQIGSNVSLFWGAVSFTVKGKVLRHRYTVTTTMILNSDGQQCQPIFLAVSFIVKGKVPTDPRHRFAVTTTMILHSYGQGWHPLLCCFADCGRQESLVKCPWTTPVMSPTTPYLSLWYTHSGIPQSTFFFCKETFLGGGGNLHSCIITILTVWDKLYNMLYYMNISIGIFIQ